MIQGLAAILASIAGAPASLDCPQSGCPDAIGPAQHLAPSRTHSPLGGHQGLALSLFAHGGTQAALRVWVKGPSTATVRLVFFEPGSLSSPQTRRCGPVTACRFDVRARGLVKIEARSPGYLSQSQVLDLQPTADRQEVITLHRAIGLRGRVIDGATGHPIPRAKVVVTGPSVPAIDYQARKPINETRTDLDGRFIFDEFGRGQYAVSVRAHRFAPYFRPVGLINDPVEIELKSGRRWRIRITGPDLARKARLLRLKTVNGSPGLGEVRVLKDGWYETPAVLPGRYVLSISKRELFATSPRYLAVVTLAETSQPVVALPDGQSTLRVTATTAGLDLTRTTVEITLPPRDGLKRRIVCSVGLKPCVFEHLVGARYSVALVVDDPTFNTVTIAQAEVLVPSKGTVEVTLPPEPAAASRSNP